MRKPKRDKFIVLVGAKDPLLVRLIQDQFGGSINMWNSLPSKSFADAKGAESIDESLAWEPEKVIELIKATASDEILIINEKKKLKVIPFQKV